MFETSLRTEAQRRLVEIGKADLLVGVPSYKNAATIGAVIEAAAAGLQACYPSLRAVIAVVDGGSADETTHLAATCALPPAIHRIVTLYQGIQGKGSAVRAIFEMARALGVKVCIVLEADLVGVAGDWIQKLAAPVLSAAYDYAIPTYALPLSDGAVNDLLVYPLTRLLYGVDVRQPMAGNFAVSGALAARFFERDVWETDVARRGLDIWMTTIAVNENVRLCQVRLGAKVESRREAVSFDPEFVQAVGTLFRMMDIYRRRWQEPRAPRAAPFYGDGATLANQRLSTAAVEMLCDAFQAGARHYRRLWRAILAPSHLGAISDLANRPRGATRLTSQLWARAVFDFAVVYNQGENDPDKVVAALLPLHYARLAAMLHETGANLDAVEQAVQAQAETFAEQKPYLLHRWNTYVPWEVDGVR